MRVFICIYRPLEVFTFIWEAHCKQSMESHLHSSEANLDHGCTNVISFLIPDLHSMRERDFCYDYNHIARSSSFTLIPLMLAQRDLIFKAHELVPCVY